MIGYNGIKLLKIGANELLDAAPEKEYEEKIRNVAGAVDGVRGIEKCLLRKSRLRFLIDIHVEVDAELPVWKGHQIAHRVKDALLASEHGVADVLVHVEPYPPVYENIH